MLAVLVGGLMIGTAAASDDYLHRGIETGETAPYALHPLGREPAVNVDLWDVPPGDLPREAERLREAGFRYARQTFPWAEIEPSPDAFDWDRADAIVAALGGVGIQPIAVLAVSPDWAREPGAEAAVDAAPLELDAFGVYVGAFLEHFGGRVGTVQVWDHPNDPVRWGGEAPSAVDYGALLAVAANAARSAAPAPAPVRVVLAELAPAPDGGATDLVFLDALYRSGARPFFDVVAAVVDGGARSPFDRRVEPERTNLSRTVLFRELMLDQGDGEKPVWATHFGWAAGGPTGVGAASQAEFVVTGLDRAREEWPWLGLAVAWAWAADGPEDPAADYALVGPGGTEAPLLAELSGRAASADVAPPGWVPPGTRGEQPLALAYDGQWSDVGIGESASGRRTTSQVGAAVTVRFTGSGLNCVLRYGPRSGPVRVTLDGGPLPGSGERAGDASLLYLDRFEALDVPVALAAGLEGGEHELRVELVEPGELTFGGAVVVRELPTLWPVVVLAGVGALVIFFGLREGAYLFAQRGNFLPRRRAVELGRPLDGWQPTRRA
ncbi:MAG: hypothetical protein AVDCRST_MAG49-3985 [uncultured Thermomicrobiales bacterium]|uniref:Glycoside hydrolase family 42 N-terminal domain-containing protein n=1 Tax=uncultured Thermomicrobiales bacterium TaxID=1645740 RepID=A0A6J4VBL2_9BACT|nr:MAG: hypothetical protein AVDCRST_MAG49-3985 [uncultured Thermomicrobiales bacterium]